MVWPFPKGISIRLHRVGCANRPYYQVGIAKKRQREGPPLDEVIGSFDPYPNERGEVIACVDLKRLSYYMGKGADCSRNVERILGLAGFLPLNADIYAIAWENRKRLIERNKKRIESKLENKDEQK